MNYTLWVYTPGVSRPVAIGKEYNDKGHAESSFWARTEAGDFPQGATHVVLPAGWVPAGW